MARHKLNGAEDGRPFAKGVSGNPGGRPKSERAVVEFARTHGMEAIEAKLRIIRDPKARHSDINAAADSILDRAFGRPKQVAEHTFRGTLRELSDDELLAIIGGARDAVPQAGEEQSGSVH